MAGRRAGERAERDAPGEFLSEFLSAIMQRQYAEALKYCRLILQYEPHNATARGFFPLLQHKLRTHDAAMAAMAASGGSPQHAAGQQPRRGLHLTGDAQEQQQQQELEAEERGEREESVCSRSRSGSADSAGSSGSQFSLELDSSSAPADSSRSLSLSRRTDITDSATGASGASAVSGVSGALGGWSRPGDSSTSPLSAYSAERCLVTNESDTDDNGNPPPSQAADNSNPPPSQAADCALEDARNDNVSAGCAGSVGSAECDGLAGSAATAARQHTDIFGQKLLPRR